MNDVGERNKQDETAGKCDIYASVKVSVETGREWMQGGKRGVV